MSIDAQVYAIEKTDEGLKLKLMPRTPYHPAGQRSLTIINPTWTPPIDSQMWGGGIVEIVGAPHKYRSVGYTRIEEIKSEAQQ